MTPLKTLNYRCFFSCKFLIIITTFPIGFRPGGGQLWLFLGSTSSQFLSFIDGDICAPFVQRTNWCTVRIRAEHKTGGPGVLSCRTERVFYFCPVLPPTRTKVGSRTGQKMLIRAEHRTGGPGVLSCRTGRVFGFCPVLPPARTKVGSRTGQKILSCAHLWNEWFVRDNLAVINLSKIIPWEYMLNNVVIQPWWHLVIIFLKM